MFARLATVFLLASAALVSAAPVDSPSEVLFKRQDDALAGMLGNLNSVTGNTLSLINGGDNSTLTDDTEATYTSQLVDALNNCANNIDTLPEDTGLETFNKRTLDLSGGGDDRSRRSYDRGRSVTEVIVIVLNSRDSFRGRGGRDEGRGRNNENELDIALAILLASLSRGGREDIVLVVQILIIQSSGRKEFDNFGHGLSKSVLNLY